MVDTKLCERCRYRGYFDFQAQVCCDYLWITGHARTLLPQREDGLCSGFEEGEKLYSDFSINRPTQPTAPVSEESVTFHSKYDFDAMERLYAEGAPDKEIAAAMGCGKSTVWKWRQFRGLPPNLAPATEPKFDRVAMMALYRKGYGDKMIARMLGCTHTTVFRWREKNNLPPVTMHIWQPLSLSAKKMRELYDKGLNDRQIAEAMGCGITSVQRWRGAEGLIAQRWRKQGREDK